MDIFKALLYKDSKKKDTLVSAIRLDKSVLNQYGSYYHYRFDLSNNTYYINDLHYPWKINQVSVTNIIETLALKMMHSQLNFFNGYVKAVLKNRTPRFIYFNNRDKLSDTIVRQTVTLQSVMKNEKIIAFKNPIWWKATYIDRDKF